MAEWCDNFWGSHGCGLPKGHPGPHRCGPEDAEPCSEHDGITSVRYYALSDFRRILDVALTAWVPTFLRGDEEDRASSATPELELERTQMHTLVATFVADLEPIHRAILLGKSQGMADGELAQRVGRSRPWLADRKAEVLARVQSDVIEQLPDGLHDDAFRHMLDQCAALEEVDP